MMKLGVLLMVVIFGAAGGCAARKTAKQNPDTDTDTELYGGRNVMMFTESNFQEEVLDNTGVVLVDFYADWCGPCRMLTPVLEEIAKESKGKYKIGKVNVDEDQALAAKYRVSSIPKMVVFKDGKVVDQMVGLQTKAQIKAALKEAAEGDTKNE